MRSQRKGDDHSIRPQTNNGSIDRDVDASDAEGVAGNGEEEEVLGEEAMDAEEEDSAQGRGEPVKAVRNPGAPSKAERAAHEIPHWPYRSWCDACARSRGLGQPHRCIDTEDKESTVPRAAMDYGFIKEDQTTTEDEHGEAVVAKVCMTILVMVETLCNSVWAYAIEGKGAASTDWLAPRIVEDMGTIGMAKERIITKSDQEPAIVQLQHEVARLRKDAGTAIENSRVGDSNSNGAVERAIREVKGMTRTLRCHLEDKLNKKIKLDDPIVPWMVRHAAYIITRCRVGPDGKTAMQKLKGRRVVTQMVPFGEAVLFKLPKVPNMPGDFQDRFETGIWLGLLVRSGEHLVGTERGVYTVSSVMRCSEDRKWSTELVDNIKGTPREPVPGSGSHKLHAYAKNKDETDVRAPKFEPRRPDEPAEVRPLYIKKTDVEELGPTPGCPGCRALLTPGSRGRAKHTAECRARLEEALSKTEEGAKRVERANERVTRELAERGEAIMAKQAEERDANASAEAASGSGTSDEQRQRELEELRKKENTDANMDEQPFGPHGHEAPMTPKGAPSEVSRQTPAGAQGEFSENRFDTISRKGVSAPGTPTGRNSPLGMETDDGAELEEAPRNPNDIRVPLAERAPASKRGRAEASPDRASKWQTFEKQATEPEIEAVEPEGPECDELDKAFEEFLARYPDPNCGDINLVDATSAQANKESSQLMGHPGPKVKRREIEKNELSWQDVGSGTFARTFLDVKRLFTTTRGGPPLCDVHRRTIWSLRTGQVIDDCFVDDAPDAVLQRELPEKEDIRIELVMKNALAMYERHGADVVELYSQPRIAQEATAKLYGGTKLTPGWSLDLTRLDPKTGKPWDLSSEKVQSRVVRMIAEGKPLFVIGSPPCTAFSSMQNLSIGRRDPKTVAAERRAGERHMEFCLKIYSMQVKEKRFFVHEHPATATSWEMESMVKMLATEGVDSVTLDMCQFGMTAMEHGVEKPVRKNTRIVSNSREILKRVEVKCPNRKDGNEVHNHAKLESGRMVKRAQVYPKKFCQAICEGIAAQKRLHALGLDAKPLLTMEEMMEALDSVEMDGDHEDPSEALHEEDAKVAFDDQSGEPLIPGMVKTARREEIAYFREREVYEKVSLNECWRTTGSAPIGVKWVDVNKGDSQHPNYRSRLVAMEFKRDERPEWYAATPPSECLKILLSLMAGSRKRKLLYADVSRAYFYARAARPVYVKLPEEDREPGDDNMCGRLKVSMYGTRDAALNWATEYGETLKAAGYQQGVSNPCLFWHPAKEVTIMVHGDDFVAIGDDEQLAETERTLAQKYKIKTEKLGAGAHDAKEVRVLNKVIRYTDEGLELEADPRHAELVVRDLGLEDAKTCKTPGVKAETRRTVKKSGEEDQEDAEDEQAMAPRDATQYRAVVARLNYMAADRPDIQFAVKEVARNMSAPLASHWHALKRIGTYLKGRPRLVLKYHWQQTPSTAVTYTDSDWAGCKKTGKSTSGGIVTLGGHVIKSYARQQKTVALSSAEAELHAMVAASAETIGLINLCKDMGLKLEGEVYADSSAAIGIAQRNGCGKVRHLRVQALWVQEVRSTGRLGYRKVLGSRNPADVLTKHVPAELLDAHLRTIGLEVRGGRAASAPALDSVEAWTLLWLEKEEPRKRVTFSGEVEVKEVEATGKCRRTAEAKAAKTRKKGVSWVQGGAYQQSWVDATDEEEGEEEVLT